MKTLVVLGASGTLGRRLVALAARVLPGLEVVAASRGGGAVGVARGVALDLADVAALRRAISGAEGALVNAVGPYRYDPTPLVRACVEAGFHYLDLAETPGFREACAGAAREAGAAGRGIAVVSGASTTPGLVELLAQGWAGDPGVTGIDAWLSLGSRNPIGAGMLEGLLRPLGRRDEAGTSYFRTAVTRAGRRYGRYPAGFSGGRLALGEREVPVRFFVGFDRALLVRSLAAGAPVLARLSDTALSRLARAALPVARLVSRLGTSRGSLVLEAAGGQGSIEVIAERDGLDIPAAPALWAVRALREAEAQRTGPSGSVRLRDVVPLQDAVAALRDAGAEVRGLP